MHELNRAELPLPSGDMDDGASGLRPSLPGTIRPDYLPPEIITLTEADILAALGPAHTGSMENPFGIDGMGGM